MFNKETEYALRALVYIQLQNYQGRRPGLAEIAAEIESPPYYTAKILHGLVRKGFISSLKGKGGGFFFDPEAPELALRDLILSVEGGKVLTGCGFGMNKCDDDHPCALHQHYVPIREAINRLVSEETIQSLAREALPERGRD